MIGSSAELDLKVLIADLNRRIPAEKLSVWTGGNLSGRLAGAEEFWIKPSGIPYENLEPNLLVKCDLNGNRLEGDLQPSSDSYSHAYIYRNMQSVNGVVHTHSNYATAWAAIGSPIPCVLTAIADEFGGDIPIGPFAPIGNDEIGRGVVETLTNSRSRAVLMRNHGVFTVGVSPSAALKAAVMCEDVAKTVWIASSIGELNRLPTDVIDALYDRYQISYGQKQSDQKPDRSERSN